VSAIDDWRGIVENPFFTFESVKHEASVSNASFYYFVFLLPLVFVMFSLLLASGDINGIFGFAGWLALGLILIVLAGFIGFGLVKMLDSVEKTWQQALAVGIMIIVYLIAGMLFVSMPQSLETQTKTTLYFVSLLFRLILFIAASAGVSYAVCRAFGGSGSFEQHFQGLGLLFAAFAIAGALTILPLFSILFVNYSEGGLEFSVANFGYAAVLGFELAIGLALLLFGSFIASNVLHKEAVVLASTLFSSGSAIIGAIAILAALAFAVLAGRAAFEFFRSTHGFSPQKSFSAIAISTVLYAVVLYALVFTGILKP